MTRFKAPAILWSVAVLALTFDIGFYILALKPKEKELAGLESEYQAKRVNKKSVARGRDEIAKEFKRVYDGFPKWDDFTRVMGEIYGRAEKLNLLVESATYRADAVKSSNLVKITVSMPVTGSYADIKRFIYELETSPRLFIIQDLSLGSGKAEEGDVSLKLAIAVHFKG